MIRASLRISFYALSTAILLPLFLLHLSSAVPHADGLGDSFQFIWNLWWVKHTILHGQTPFRTDLLFWPEGTSLVFHTLTLTNGLLSIPVQLLVPGTAGLVASLNLLTLASFALTGLAAHMIARDAGASRFGACAAGLLAMSLPYRLWHINHLNILSTQWGLFTLWCFQRALQQRRTTMIFTTALCAALTTYADYETAVSTAVVGLVIFVWQRMAVRQKSEAATLTTVLASIMGLAFVLHIPLLVYLLRLQQGDAVLASDPAEVSAASVNLIGFVLPGAQNLLYGNCVPADLAQGHGAVGDQVFLGVAFLIALAVRVLRYSNRSTWMWIASGGVLLILALGPSLQVGSATLLDGWMPYAWLRRVFPLLAFNRCPLHMISMGATCWAIALGTTFLPSGRDRSRRAGLWRVLDQPLVQVGLLLVLLLERYPRFPPPMQAVRVPELYTKLAADPAAYAIMPTPASYYHRNVYMFWQTVHGKPLTDGCVSRETLRSGRWRDAYEAAPDEAARLALLHSAGVRLVVTHTANVDALLADDPQVELVPPIAP